MTHKFYMNLIRTKTLNSFIFLPLESTKYTYKFMITRMSQYLKLNNETVNFTTKSIRGTTPYLPPELI